MNGIIGGIKANLGTIVKVGAIGAATVALAFGVKAAVSKASGTEMVDLDGGNETTEESSSEE